ncbi:hypothetical protein K440DRAFT_581778 [Wilcoxina mikolae CBS 423.85]|nr:hypothetical protein K440DRAFT_581778 [Wilcoxina mikolae CBS 423.85]
MPSGSDGGLYDYDTAPVYRPPRSLLLPTNRRLRNLSSISLRNLGKRQPQQPQPHDDDDDDDDDNDDDHDNAYLDPREAMKRRRRSTKTFRPGELRRWEGVVAGRRGDVFFTLHVPGAEEGEVVYISEVVEKTMNPDFQPFDLNACDPVVSRRNDVVVKVWCDFGEGWTLAVEAEVKLAALTFLGRTLESWGKPLPANCVVWYLSDGCYTSFWDEETPPEVPPVEPGSLVTEGAAMTTSSYDALMKLNNLSDCIQDAESTTSHLTSQISALITQESTALTLPRAVDQAREHASTVRKAVTTERRRLESSQRRLQELTNSLTNRRAAMRKGREAQAVGERYLLDNQSSLTRCKTALSSTREAISAQQKRIVAVLMEIYPIMPHPSGESLAFTIRSLHLPSSSYEDYDDATVSAALGHVAQLIYLLSYYLGTPLRYPVKATGSRSFVRDDISVIQGARTFPLWMKGTVYYRFEYAVFLVNKDVQQLMSKVGLHCVDIRHTLANLKSLLLFINLGGAGGGRERERDRNLLAATTMRATSRSSTPVPGGGYGNGHGSLRAAMALGQRRVPDDGGGGAGADLVGRHNHQKESVVAVKPAPIRPYSFLAGRGV